MNKLTWFGSIFLTLTLVMIFTGCSKDDEDISVEGVWDVLSFTSGGSDVFTLFGIEGLIYDFKSGGEVVIYQQRLSGSDIQTFGSYTLNSGSSSLNIVNGNASSSGDVEIDDDIMTIEGEDNQGNDFIMMLQKIEDDPCASTNCTNRPCRYGICLELQQWLNEGTSPLTIINNIGDLNVEDFYGLEYEGGLIFLLDVNDQYDFDGLVVSEEEAISDPLPWGCSGEVIPTPQEVGFGKSNTQLVIDRGCLSSSDAISRVDALQHEGYSDWYVPTVDELKLISANLIDEGHLTVGGGNYWSSCAVNNQSAFFAYAVHLNTNTRTGNSRIWDGDIFVRPVREF